jgi:hypothetical protein
MPKNKNLISTIILFSGILLSVLYFMYKNYNDFAESPFLNWVVTLIVGLIVVILYIVQKYDNRRDAARSVLQEIRRAEKIISDYKEHGHFKFTKKIIATNSWAKNMHYFIEEISFENLDRISDLYSTGEYLDSIIKMVSDVKFDTRTHESIKNQSMEQIRQQIDPFMKKIEDVSMRSQPLIVGSMPSTAGDLQNGFKTIGQGTIPEKIDLNVNLNINSIPTDVLFTEIVGKYDPIYNTDVVNKLKEIAKLK